MVNPDYEMEGNFDYDWSDIKNYGFDVDPRTVERSNEKLTFRFSNNDEQKRQIQNAKALHPNSSTGAPLIYNQNLKV